MLAAVLRFSVVAIPCLLLSPAAIALQDTVDAATGQTSRAYIDADDQRPLADLTFALDRSRGRSLQLTISATGPRVEPIGGYRGIAGANHYTAEELDRMLRGLYDVQVRTQTADGQIMQGTLRPDRFGHLPERRFIPGHPVNFLAQSVDAMPLSIIVDAAGSGSGHQVTEVLLNGIPRLTVEYAVEGDRFRLLGVHSDGHDNQVFTDARWVRPGSGDRPAIDRWHLVMARGTRESDLPKDLLTDWDERDAEGRWVLIRGDLDTHPEHIDAWIAYLAAHQEFAMLEWLAVYVPDAFKSHEVGSRLTAAEAPQWLRVAVWHMDAPLNVGHSRQVAAEIVVYQQPGVVEHWLTAHRNQIDNWAPHVEQAHQQLVADDTPPKNSGHLLPPLQPDDVFRHLSPAGRVVTFGDRLTADTDTVYVHQVLRAIDGVVVSGRRTPAILAQVRTLTRHDNLQIRHAALMAFTWLAPRYPGTETFADLLAIVNDNSTPDILREAALLGYSYHHHPSVVLTLHRIAEDPDHPAWSAAVSRLGDLGGEFSIPLLGGIDVESLDETQQTILTKAAGMIVMRGQAEVTVSEAAARLRVAAFARQQNHPYADRLTQWALKGGQELNSQSRRQLSVYPVFPLGEIWLPGERDAFERDYRELLDRAIAWEE